LPPKSEKCIFVGYFENIEGYKFLQIHSSGIIIMRDVRFDENMSTCKLDSMLVPSSTHKASLTSMSSSLPNFSVSDPIMVSFLDDNSEDENQTFPTHLLPVESIEHEPTLAPILPKWVHIT